MMDTSPGLHEHISALADGELAASELELAFAALDTDAGRQAWHTYRLIGEALRAGQDASVLSAGFDAGLAGRLAAEAARGPAPASASAPAAVLAAVAPAAEALDIGIAPLR